LNSLANRALEHVKYLSVQIGSRPIGLAANLVAAGYISSFIAISGLSIERREIPCPNRDAEPASLDCNGELWESSVYTFLPFCDVSGATEPVLTILQRPGRYLGIDSCRQYIRRHQSSKGDLWQRERSRRSTSHSHAADAERTCSGHSTGEGRVCVCRAWH